MKIAACLCWYDEQPDSLYRLVRSLDGVVDSLVSADGRWEHFAGPTHSPLEQHDAIASAVAEIGLEHRLIFSDEVYESQVAKRNALYMSAAESCDWLFVVDGDEFVTDHATTLRSALAVTEWDVAMVRCHNVDFIRPSRPIVRDLPHRRFFRAVEGLHVIEAHNGVVTGDGRWLAGPRRIVREPALDLCESITIEHHHWSRPRNRNIRAQKYYQMRNKLRVEVH